MCHGSLRWLQKSLLVEIGCESVARQRELLCAKPQRCFVIAVSARDAAGVGGVAWQRCDVVTGHRQKWVVVQRANFPRHFLVYARKLRTRSESSRGFSTFNSAPAVYPQSLRKNIMEQQFYQPLSAALHPPLAHTTNRSPQSHYPPYLTHAHPSTSNGTHHIQREEEEDDDDDDDEVVEEELDHSNRDHPSPRAHSSPRVSAGHPGKRST